MRVPTKRQMQAINEREADIASALTFWRGEAVRLELSKTFRAITGAIKVAKLEIAEARDRFESSGRRSHKR